jgi:hypothetical protein
METATFHKLFGKVFIKALLLGLLPASHAFYKSADLRSEDALVGDYAPEGPTDPVVSDSERETMSIARSRGSSRGYAISISNADGTMTFDARLFQLAVASAAPAYFLDLSPKRDGKRRFAAAMKHLTAEIVRRGDGLDFLFLRSERIGDAGLEASVSSEREKECGADPAVLYSAGEYCSRVLSAPTDALRDLLRDGARDKLFDRPVSLYRIKRAGS